MTEGTEQGGRGWSEKAALLKGLLHSLLGNVANRPVEGPFLGG